MTSPRSKPLFLALLTFLLNCDKVDVTPFDACRIKEITYEVPNVANGERTILFEYNDQNQITRVGNHIWEQIDVTYKDGLVSQVLRMTFRYLNPRIDTVAHDFTYEGNTILVTRSLLRRGTDSLLGRSAITLTNGRITAMEIRTASDRQDMQFNYEWTNGNITEVNGYDSLGRHRYHAVLEFDTGRNPMVQLGLILVDPVRTSANNFTLKSFSDPLTGFSVTYGGVTLGGPYNSQGYPNTVRFPFYSPGLNVGQASYENCE